MEVIAIAARSSNGVIGKGNSLPWPHNRQDLNWFKGLTSGCPIIMGRKTYESLPGILPFRPHYIISREAAKHHQIDKRVKWIPPQNIGDLIDAFKQCNTERIFIVGGTDTYQSTSIYTTMLMLRTFNEEYEGDKMFPTDSFTHLNKLLMREQWNDSVTEVFIRG